MKVADLVRVYEDPVTCKKLEGVAVLLRRPRVHYYVEPGLEVWEVRFIGEPGYDPEVVRTINVAESSKEG